MPHRVTFIAAVVVLVSGSPHATAQPAERWVGQTVITRSGAVLKIGRKVVEDGEREAGSRGGQRHLVRVYRVERASGPWLWLVALHEGTRGWARAVQVVPCDQALDQFTRAIRANPKDAWAFLSRGILRHEKGEYDKAIADFNEANRLDPADAVVFFNRGRAWKAKHEHGKAIADLSEAIRLDSKHAAAYNYRGCVWHEKGEYDKAIADYNEATRLDPRCPSAYNNRGADWLEKHEYDKAIADFNEAIRLDPRDATYYNNRGGVWLVKDEYDKAIADLSEAIRLDPRPATVHRHRGAVWLQKGAYDKAIADCNEAIRLDPKDAKAYFYRCAVWCKKGAYDKALADCTEAIRLDPKDAAAYYARCGIWCKKGAYDKALADCNEAIRLDPSCAAAYNKRGDVWYEKGECDKALADYNEAIRLDPSYAAAFDNRGFVWHKKGECDKAIADYNEAIRLDPRSARAYNNRGAAELEKGEYDKAMADLNEATRLDPTYGMPYHNRGGVWYKKGENDKAVAELNEAIRLDPRYAHTYNNRGIIWLEKRAYDQAIADFNEAIRLDPRHAAAYHNRSAASYKKGEYPKALADCNEAIRLDPKLAAAYVVRAWIWAACSDASYRDGKRAVESATRACELTHWKTPEALEILAAACAEAGDFDAAVKWQEKFLESAKEGPDKMLAAARLSHYRANEPYHDEPVASATDKIATGVDISVQQVEAELEGPPKVDQAVSPSSLRVPRPPAAPEQPRRIVAHVGAEVITLDELKEAVQVRIAKLPDGDKPSRDELKTLTGHVLDLLIERSTLVLAAKRELKNPAQVKLFMDIADRCWCEEELPPLLREMGVENVSELKAKLAAHGRSLEVVRESYKLDFLARSYMEVKLKPRIIPSDSELLDYYNAHRDDFRRADGPTTFAEAQDEVRKIVRGRKIEREATAFVEGLRRQTIITTIYDKEVEAKPEP